MARVYTNSASTTLTSTYSASDTVLSLTDGSQFATVASGDTNFQAVTLENTTTGQFEIAHITDRVGNVITVSRGEEGTFAIALPAAEIIVEARLTAEALTGIFDANTDAIAIGDSAIAGTTNTTAVGANATVTAGFGVAVGNLSSAGATYATAIGALNNAQTTFSAAVGYSNTATGATYSYSFGGNNSNSAALSVVIGKSNAVTGGEELQILGNDNSIGTVERAIVVGRSNTASTVNDFIVVGSDNTVTNEALIVGNGFGVDAASAIYGATNMGADFQYLSLDNTYLSTDRSAIQRSKAGGWVTNPHPRQLIANQVTCAGLPIDIGVPQAFSDLVLSADEGELWEPNTPNGKQYYAYASGFDTATGTQTGAVTFSNEPTYPSVTGDSTQSNVTNASGYVVCVDPANYYITAGYDANQTVPLVVSEFGVVVNGATVQSGSVTAELRNNATSTAIATLTITLTAEGGTFVQSTQVDGKQELADRFHVVITANTMTDPCPAKFYVTGTLFAL